MLLNIDREVKMPLYIQIYHALKDKIHQQELQTNEKLPSKRQLADLNDVSENTIMSAYNQLLTEGYIYSLERKGYYVSDVAFHYELPTVPLENEDSTKKTQPIIKYDLTRSKPDEKLFPFSVFSKLYRNLFSQSQEQLLGETAGQGLLELRSSIQQYLSQSRGVPCTTRQIILGPSAEFLMANLVQLLDQPVVGIEEPGYHGFLQLLKRTNIPFVPIPVDKSGAQVEELPASNINLMCVTSNHQFPTGSIMPLPRRQQLLDWADGSNERYILENDYDSEFKYSGIPIPSLKYLDQNNKVIHLGSFTRVLSPGIRISYMVLPEKLLARYQEKFPSQSASLSTSEQWLIHHFMAEGHFTTHLNRSRTFYKKKRDRMIQEIKRCDPEASIFGEKAGLHLLVKPSFHFDGKGFREAALQEGILLNLLSYYSLAIKPKNEQTIFLSFSNIPETDIGLVIQKLFEMAQKLS